ncbi:MAG: ClpXP protease specificity-enhancing factor [Candidatus Protistobacter heckmanni]|nr:ClpXP protease specificity-enhancing factor [Candidatus Protistobacter heckmanni]
MEQPPSTSTKPYMLRAIYEWCTDNGFTPYIAVFVDTRTQVLPEYVKNNEIVLNISFEATSELSMGNDWVSFRARFGGVPRKIDVPVDNVLAIYARENGQGMAFPVERALPVTQARTEHAPPPKLAAIDTEAADKDAQPTPTPDPDPNRPGGGRPSLKVVK